MNDFPWYKSYPAGTPHEVQLYEYDSINELFEDSCKKFADRVAFENMGAQLTFRQVDKLSRDFAAYLQSLGLKRGERIAIQMPNLLQFPIAFFGALRAGLIIVNTNPLYTPREMEHQFKDSEAVAIVIVANFASNLEKIIGNTKIRHVIVTKLGDMLGGVKGMIVNFVVKNVKKMVPDYHLPQAVSFSKVVAQGASLPYTKPEISIQDLAVLQYTGGTTGVSKGAQLSHANIIAHNSMIKYWFI
jgi:long-chain acyl-CoA synthetase